MENSKAAKIVLMVAGVIFLILGLYNAATKGFSMKPLLNVISGGLFLTAGYVTGRKK